MPETNSFCSVQLSDEAAAILVRDIIRKVNGRALSLSEIQSSLCGGPFHYICQTRKLKRLLQGFELVPCGIKNKAGRYYYEKDRMRRFD